MNKEKRALVFSILLALSVLLVIVAVIVPTTHIVAKDTNEIVVYDKSVNLIQYIIDSPFILTDATDIYFNATGPIWLATASILFNILIAIGGIVASCVCLIELCTKGRQNMSIKNNILAKKLCLFVGWFSSFICIFAIASFVITTLMANGYAQFNLSFAPFVILVISICMIVLSYMTGKRTTQQQSHKLKDSLGFALSCLFGLLGIGLLFIPQYSLEFGLGVTSLWDVGRSATTMSSDSYIYDTFGDYPFGFANWVMFVLFIATIFIFVYCLFGFVRSLRGKSTSWLSSRIKRWSMTYLITYSILYMFVLCQSAVWWSTIVVVEPNNILFSLMPYAYVLMFVPYLPYVFSTFVSCNKKIKRRA